MAQSERNDIEAPELLIAETSFKSSDSNSGLSAKAVQSVGNGSAAFGGL
jgi:hypothetical protein